MKYRFKWSIEKGKLRNYDEVLVTVSNNEVTPPERVVVQAYYVNGTFFDATFNTELTDVVAWTLQPKPYEEDLYGNERDSIDEHRQHHGSTRIRSNRTRRVQDGSEE